MRGPSHCGEIYKVGLLPSSVLAAYPHSNPSICTSPVWLSVFLCTYQQHNQLPLQFHLHRNLSTTWTLLHHIMEFVSLLARAVDKNGIDPDNINVNSTDPVYAAMAR